MSKVVLFLNNTVKEIRSITWPGRKEALGFSAVVLVLVFVVSFYILLADFVISQILGIFI